MRSTTLVCAFVSLVFVAGSALAKPKGHKKADGPSAAETWTDPVDSEKSDKGPFAPHSEEDVAPKPVPRSPRAPDPGRKRDKIQAFGQIMIGFGRAPVNQPSYAPGDKGTAIGFQLGGRYDVNKQLSAGLRIPFTTATIQRPTGNLSSTVFGSPELFAEYRLSLARLTSVPLFFGIGIPLAQGNPDDTATRTDTVGGTKAYVNRLADATSGWRDTELFQPKRLPLIVGGGIHHERQDWELHGDLKFVFLPALSTTVAHPTDTPTAGAGTYKMNGLGLREVTTLGGSYNFLSDPLIYAGLDLAFVWTPLETFDFNGSPTPSKPTTLQAVLEPRVGARFGRIAPSVGYVAPLGGRLGDAGDGGVRLRVDAYF